MARRRASRQKRRIRRVVNANANRLRLPRSPVSPSLSPLDLSIYQDRRHYHPLRAYAPAFSFGSTARLPEPSRIQPRSQTKARITFSDPRKVLVCVRRKERREVLFARGVGGARGLRKGKRGPFSHISCKR